MVKMPPSRPSLDPPKPKGWIGWDGWDVGTLVKESEWGCGWSFRFDRVRRVTKAVLPRRIVRWM